MTYEDAAAIRELYRQAHPDAAAFWHDLGRQAHWELTVEGLCGYNPQLLLEPPSFERDLLRALAARARVGMKLTYDDFCRSFHPHQQRVVMDFETYSMPKGRLYFSPTLRRPSEPEIADWHYHARAEIQIVAIDFGEVEARVMRDIRGSVACRFLDEIDIVEKQLPSRPQPDYLQHDPTKRHRRRRR